MATSTSTELFLQYIPKADGTPNALGIVKTYAAGTTTPKATYPTYADALAGTNANATTITLGADGVIFFFMVGSYKIDIQNAAGTSLSGWPKDNIQGAYLTQSAADLIYANINKPLGLYSTTGSSNAYVLTPSPAITDYAAGQMWIATPNFANTTASVPTINVSGKGALQIIDMLGNNLVAGALNTSTPCLFVISDPTGAGSVYAFPLKSYARYVNISGTISAASYDLTDYQGNGNKFLAVTASGVCSIDDVVSAGSRGPDVTISAAAGTKTMISAVLSAGTLTVNQRVITDTTGGIVSTNLTITSVWILT